MISTLRIGSTDYDRGPTGRPAAGIFDMRLRLTVELGQCNTLAFMVKVCGSNAPFVPGVTVKLTVSNDDGSGSQVVFQGDLDAPEVSNTQYGYCWAYTCTDLKHRSNWVTIAGLDGSGSANFNLRPDDPNALYATSGETVGSIVKQILEAPLNATALNALGVGAYASMTPPTLPSTTLADLAALSVGPPEPVQLQGEGILNTLEQFIVHWHAQYALWVQPDGTIRVKSIFAFTNQTLTVPTDATNGDPIDWPTYSGPDCRGCFSAVTIRGLDIARAELSVVDGTLKKYWTTAQQAAWTIDDFLQPKDGSDDGDLSGVTSTSCTVTSDHATTHWVTNFWNLERGGWIQFIDLAGTGITVHEERQITSCTAMTPGGTATITWDTSLPLATTAYTRYHIRGLNSPLALVDRRWYVCEPGNTIAAVTGPPAIPAHQAVGLETFIGSHLYPRFPKGTWLENLSSTQQIFYPAAYIRWSSDGNYPWFEVPIKVQVDPTLGVVTLAEPGVSKFGDPVVLERGYPTSFSDGLWHDVRAVVPYNRGTLAARAPSSGHTGLAHTLYGITRERFLPLDSFTYVGDSPALATLAAELLAVVKDPIIEGSVVHYDIPTAWNIFQMGYALSFVFPDTSPIDGYSNPVRTTEVHWPEDGALHMVNFQYSNLKRPFEGDALYIHPGLSGQTFGTQGDLWIGGNVGGFSGSADMGDFNAMGQQMGQMSQQVNPLSQAMENNPLANQGNALGSVAGNNQIGDAIANAQSGGTSDLSLDPSQFQSTGGYKGSRLDQEKAAKSYHTAPENRAEGKDAGTPIAVDEPPPRRKTLREQRFGDEDTP